MTTSPVKRTSAEVEKLNLSRVSSNMVRYLMKFFTLNEYIEIKKEFVGKKPRTSYKITEVGKLAFQQHLAFLEKIMRQ